MSKSPSGTFQFNARSQPGGVYNLLPVGIPPNVGLWGGLMEQEDAWQRVSFSFTRDEFKSWLDPLLLTQPGISKSVS